MSHDPIGLTEKGTDTVVVWACGICRIVCSNKVWAREHCATRICVLCASECEQRWRTTCDMCHGRQRQAKLDDATEVEGPYGGFVWSELYSEYYSDADSYLDDMEGMETEPEEFLYACTSFSITLDSDRILENVLEAHHENATAEIVDQRGLQNLLDEWCRKQTVETSLVDYRRKVRVPLRQS